MKKITLFITLFALISLGVSCKNQEEKTQKSTVETKEIIKENKTEESHQESDENKIVLNNGKRWIANPETTDGIKKMVLIIKSFPKESNTEEYITLNKELETEFTTIFQKCTMKGESHEQLHNFLKPMIVLFDNLKSTDKEVRIESVDHLKKHLSTYQNYFE